MTNFYFSALNISDSFRLLLQIPKNILFGNTPLPKYRTIFETELDAEVKIGESIASPSARSGLYALLIALNIGEEDEVIVTGFTCSAVIEPILLTRARPVYVDISTDKYSMLPKELELKITNRTKAIIVQHTFGFRAPVEEITNIAATYNITVIEDCALAFGSQTSGKWLGTFADAAIWSFELSKTLTVGWGGIVHINNNPELAQCVRKLINKAGTQNRTTACQRLFQAGLSGILYHPKFPKFFNRYILNILFRLKFFRGSAEAKANNLKMPIDYQWAILSKQLKNIGTILDATLNATLQFQSILIKHGCGKILSDKDISDGIRLIRFPIQIKNPERLIKVFNDSGIEVGRWFSNPISSNQFPQSYYGYLDGDCKKAEMVCNHIINLPIHMRMRESDLELATSILDCYLATYPEECDFIACSIT